MYVYFCEQCNRPERERKVCDCGDCLFKTTKELPGAAYPMFECATCGRPVIKDQGQPDEVMDESELEA